jgi:hypothetical protein
MNKKYNNDLLLISMNQCVLSEIYKRELSRERRVSGRERSVSYIQKIKSIGEKKRIQKRFIFLFLFLGSKNGMHAWHVVNDDCII